MSAYPRPIGPPWSELMADSPKRYFAVLVCYLDDSGEDREPVITCAGYLSVLENWKRFERDARNVFNQLGLDYLHAVDVRQRRNFFKGWESTQTLDFMQRLYQLLEPDVGMGFEFSVLKSEFIKNKPKSEGSAFGFCFKGILDQMLKNEGIKDALKQPGVDISFVIESGHSNNKDVVAIFNRYKKNNEIPLGTLVLEDKKKSIALNMADYVAYFCRRIRNRTSNNLREEDLKFFLDSIGNITHHYFFATEFGVERALK